MPTTRLQARMSSSPDTPTDSVKKSPKSPKKVSFEKVSVGQIVFLGFLAATVTSGLLTFMVLKEFVHFEGKTKADQLKTYVAKLEFVLRYQVLSVTFLIYAVLRVVLKRVTTPAVDPLAGYEYLTLESRNILTNSLENFILSLVSQLIAVSYLSAGEVIKLIPLVNVLFLFGRIAFVLGYPKYRTCGFISTLAPIIVLNGMNLYKFGQHLGLY